MAGWLQPTADEIYPGAGNRMLPGHSSPSRMLDSRIEPGSRKLGVATVSVSGTTRNTTRNGQSDRSVANCSRVVPRHEDRLPRFLWRRRAQETPKSL